MKASEYKRYARQIALDQIGEKGQRKIMNARVLVIGAGGLGCPVLQSITASGIGHIGIVDGDEVSMSNLQRQLLFNQNEIGKNKAIVAAEKLKVINPNVSFDTHPYFLNADNVKDVVKNYEIIVDCTDNFASRYLINDISVKNNTPVVFGALYKFQGQVSVFNHKGGPSYRCLYPKQADKTKAPNCSEAGVWSVLPTIIGSIQANEVLKLITEQGDILSGKLMTYDSLSNQSFVTRFDLDPEQIAIALASDFQVDHCNMNRERSLSPSAFKQAIDSAENVLIDLRENHEIKESQGIKGAEQLAYSEIENWEDHLPKDKCLLLYCAGGIRSKTSLDRLISKGYDAYELNKGLEALHQTSELYE